MGRGDSDNIVELIALVLAIPGAIAALATLWILLTRRRYRPRGHIDAIPGRDLENTAASRPRDANDELTTRRAADWFQDQYIHLHREVTAERQEWAEEMEYIYPNL
ncbi:hypothetical protein BU26DRAFT_567492 [Trematosphaeria pertusa]|uniref:Uncharacterized protein n=1 Tax=Trematosphaeria pertusa TaxID=390896 RepID=A0A6A6I6L5_9PLEO|nr:uncharacterized protein BU26DRAFT_567492 [Trematosphaeria pertusa]KAF2245977.1 hypothetical protein BU26DRAFT_567492 [Trematosphaeria pertusa]